MKIQDNGNNDLFVIIFLNYIRMGDKLQKQIKYLT